VSLNKCSQCFNRQRDLRVKWHFGQSRVLKARNKIRCCETASISASVCYLKAAEWNARETVLFLTNVRSGPQNPESRLSSALSTGIGNSAHQRRCECVLSRLLLSSFRVATPLHPTKSLSFPLSVFSFSHFHSLSFFVSSFCTRTVHVLYILQCFMLRWLCYCYYSCLLH
jgi:hypothetical protein